MKPDVDSTGMSRLDETEVLFVDCQTTGMRPPKAHVLDIAWARASAQGDAPIAAQSFLCKLREDQTIPRMVQQITGINDSDLVNAKDEFEVFQALTMALSRLKEPKTVVIHYAQFEKPFLLDLFTRLGGETELPFQVVCTQQICKRLLPGLPSQNIRAASGFFGAPTSHVQRAAAHVIATHQIWRSLVERLSALGILHYKDLKTWLEQTPKPKQTNYQYRLDKLTRLNLPDQPGIYRMLTKTGSVLYVGKATSLKSRVNSYFRGQKNRDRFKLEMLAQVWDLQVTECKSALEAALLESDEIKRLDPPYNILLKRGNRQLQFYSRDFTSHALEQSLAHPMGPFRNSNWIEPLRLVYQSLREPEFLQIFYNPLASEDLRHGFDIFCAQQCLRLEKIKSPRSLLAFGLWLHKNHVELEAPVPLEDEIQPHASASDEPPTPEEIAAKYERLFRRAAVDYLRSKRLTRLLNSDVEFKAKTGRQVLRFRGGKLMNGDQGGRERRTYPWQGLMIDDFDRMAILLSELSQPNCRLCIGPQSLV